MKKRGDCGLTRTVAPSMFLHEAIQFRIICASMPAVSIGSPDSLSTDFAKFVSALWQRACDDLLVKVITTKNKHGLVAPEI